MEWEWIAVQAGAIFVICYMGGWAMLIQYKIYRATNRIEQIERDANRLRSLLAKLLAKQRNEERQNDKPNETLL